MKTLLKVYIMKHWVTEKLNIFCIIQILLKKIIHKVHTIILLQGNVKNLGCVADSFTVATYSASTYFTAKLCFFYISVHILQHFSQWIHLHMSGHRLSTWTDNSFASLINDQERFLPLIYRPTCCQNGASDWDNPGCAETSVHLKDGF